VSSTETPVGESASRRAASFLGVAIGAGTLDAIAQRALAAIDGAASSVAFACANPHSLVTAQQDPEFREALNACEIVVADGVGVSLAARALSIDVGPRVTGHDFFEGLMGALKDRGHGRVFFFGSSEHVLSLIAASFARDYPQLTLCGTLSPPFRDFTPTENESMVAAINACRADVLWVGMTAPKQEKWVHAHRQSLRVPVIGSVGAVFEFYAGTNPRAPAWMCRLGIEWVYRLLMQPRRIWRRVFVSGPRFLAAIIRSRLADERRFV
jgi:N-acetylglucosaminyldiphosphoundecaprenol N-acetyl-beta-D-mannosaminyltransferase